MTQRFELGDLVPDFYKALGRANAAVGNSGVDPLIHELVKIRASQLNGCAFCLDMHIADARKLGEEQRRLDVLAGWREAPTLFSEAEMAALALAEAVTFIADDGVPDEVWDAATDIFGDEGTAQLIAAIAMINAYNRIAVSTRKPPAA